jgi:hypothetical protein
VEIGMSAVEGTVVAIESMFSIGSLVGFEGSGYFTDK